ncbi:MAG: peroxiredoxin [Mucilaginibacter sp.]|nr:peroxiredoxin [Mucilaginibacter sp.]
MDITKEPVISASAQIDRSHYKTLIKIEDHIVISDEPLTIGGTDMGTSPQGLLLASLGSCTAITLRMYIDRKMWVVDKITVDMELFNTDSGTLIERRLSFKGDLSDDQKKRLVQIADSCPIHKMLIGNIVIETNLK